MTILLLTTLPNRMHKTLADIPNVEVTIIDFASGLSRHDFYRDLLTMTQQNTYDILLTYRCPYVIPKEIFTRFKVRLNIHPLPLPKYAGINPWESFLKSGINRAEAVLHKIVTQPDSGEIVLREKYVFNSPQEAREAADSAISRMVKKYVLTVLVE